MSTSEAGAPSGPVSLGQFIALNDELAALVRAGVPLERGLIEAGKDLRGRLGASATGLGRAMGEGLALPEAVGAPASGLPDVYRAVVEAGVRSGRLAQALEGMAALARGYAEARRAISLALIYPTIVLVLAYGLGVGFVVLIVPRFVEAFRALGLAPDPALGWLDRAGASAIYWAPIPPVVFGLVALRWAWAGRSVVLDSGGFGPLLIRMPLVGTMIGQFRAANFAGLLALLVEHRVPLDEAVVLAGEASGDRALRASASRLAGSIRSGGGAASAGPDAFPPLLSWMLRAGDRQGDLPRALASLAANYRTKGRGRAEALKLALPSACLLVIGVGAVGAYALMVFVPLLHLWDGLAIPTN